MVEDHRDSAAVASRLLSAKGYCVDVADGYGTALAKARADRFDVIICDIGLPDGDGCNLLSEVRALYDVRAIALTGYGMTADRERCEQAGFHHFLLKPVSLDQLHKAVNAVSDGLPCDNGN